MFHRFEDNNRSYNNSLNCFKIWMSLNFWKWFKSCNVPSIASSTNRLVSPEKKVLLRSRALCPNSTKQTCWDFTTKLKWLRIWSEQFLTRWRSWEFCLSTSSTSRSTFWVKKAKMCMNSLCPSSLKESAKSPLSRTHRMWDSWSSSFLSDSSITRTVSSRMWVNWQLPWAGELSMATISLNRLPMS